MDTILLDFSKAFDKVDHNKLCYKLHHYGITLGETSFMDWVILNSQWQIIYISTSRIRRISWNSTGSITISGVHKWFTTLCRIQSLSLCRWCSSLLVNNITVRPCYSSEWLAQTPNMGRIMENGIPPEQVQGLTSNKQDQTHNFRLYLPQWKARISW